MSIIYHVSKATLNTQKHKIRFPSNLSSRAEGGCVLLSLRGTPAEAGGPKQSHKESQQGDCHACLPKRHFGVQARSQKEVYPRVKHGAGSELLEGLAMTKKDYGAVPL